MLDLVPSSDASLLFSRDAFPHSPAPSNRGKIIDTVDAGDGVCHQEACSCGGDERALEAHFIASIPPPLC
jgi:hypothetical protein